MRYTAGFAAIAASGAESVEASPLGGLALDEECLRRCELPLDGAPGDGLQDLPAEFRALFGSALTDDAPNADKDDTPKEE